MNGATQYAIDSTSGPTSGPKSKTPSTVVFTRATLSEPEFNVLISVGPLVPVRTRRHLGFSGNIVVTAARSSFGWSDAVSITKTFSEHAAKWKNDTMYISSLTEVICHPSYLRIIGLGSPVLGLIFKDLQETGAYWYVALASITGENPATGMVNIPFKKVRDLWLEWGVAHGFA